MKRILITGLILTSIAGTSYAAGTGRESGSGRPATGSVAKSAAKIREELERKLEALPKDDAAARKVITGQILQIFQTNGIGANAVNIKSAINIRPEISVEVLEAYENLKSTDESVKNLAQAKLQMINNLGQKDVTSEDIQNALLVLEAKATDGLAKSEDFKKESVMLIGDVSQTESVKEIIIKTARKFVTEETNKLSDAKLWEELLRLCLKKS